MEIHKPMETDPDKATQEGNASALQEATQFLTPGERLLWAAWADPTPSYIRRIPRLAFTFIPFILLCCYGVWQSNQRHLADHAELLTHLCGVQPNIPPPMTSNPFMPVFFFGGFLLVSGANHEAPKKEERWTMNP